MMRGISQEVSNKIANMGFVCALLVVYIHVEGHPENIGSIPWMIWYFMRYVFASIAVPFFFVVSGYFIGKKSQDEDWWRGAMLKRLKTLFIPFVIWCSIMLAIQRVLLPTVARLAHVSLHVDPLTLDVLLARFGLDLFDTPAIQPYWYVRALLIFVAVSPILVFAVRKFGFRIIALLIVFYLMVDPGYAGKSSDFWLGAHWRRFWRFGFSAEGLLYFTCGILLSSCPFGVSRRKSLLIGSVGIALGCVRCALLTHGFDDYGYLVQVSIPFIMIGMWGLMSSVAWPKWMTGNSFPIYSVHMIFMLVIALIFRHVKVPFEKCSLLAVLIVWGVAVAGSLLVSVIFKKSCPQTAHAFFGGR